MFLPANFVDIHSQGMRDRSMRSGTELAREIKLTDWSTAGNLSNRFSGLCEVQLDNKRKYSHVRNAMQKMRNSS